MRYIGNKSKLLDEIYNIILTNTDGDEKIFCDLFSGTGVVGSYFRDKYKIIANDVLKFSFVLTHGYLNSKVEMTFPVLGFNALDFLNSLNGIDGFICKNYSLNNSKRMYFTENNAKKIDAMRLQIEEWYLNEKISQEEYYYLLACLLEAISLRANVAGVYGSYLKNWDSRALKEITLLPLNIDKMYLQKNEVFNVDSLELIDKITGDILYIDPPYSKNDYSTQYHLLETIIRYDNPEINGKTGTRKDKIRSVFTDKINAKIALEKIISEAKFKHIILSYNNNGVIEEKYIDILLKKHSKKFVKKEIKYQNYTNKKSSTNIKNKEFLYYIEKKHTYVESPLNYMGSKYHVLNEIVPLLNNYETVIDLFAGGFNVGSNVTSSKVIFNDINHFVRDLVNLFASPDIHKKLNYIEAIIKKYNLTKSGKESYLIFRKYYNSILPAERKVIDLFVLSQFGFQQQLRFNSSHEFNNPIGMSSYNTNTLIKIIEFNRILSKKAISFFSEDFRNLNFSIDCNTVFYIDPPYLVTLGSYNDGKRGFKGWNSEDEHDLYNYIDDIANKGGKFVLTNVFEHKGLKNTILKAWLESRDYRTKSYIHRKREEILITNILEGE